MNSNAALPENVAPGIRIGRNVPSGVEYIGSEKALIDGGYAEAEWFENLGAAARPIARIPGGGFMIAGEGKGNHLNKEHKINGAFTVSRNRDGSLSVFTYRSPDEYRRRKALDDAEREARYAAEEAAMAENYQKETWLLAKEARIEGDYPKRWKDGVLYHLKEVEDFISGRMVFTDFPDVGLTAKDVAEGSAAAAELRRILERSCPSIKDRVQVSNVVSLKAYAYRNMKRG